MEEVIEYAYLNSECTVVRLKNGETKFCYRGLLDTFRIIESNKVKFISNFNLNIEEATGIYLGTHTESLNKDCVKILLTENGAYLWGEKDGEITKITIHLPLGSRMNMYRALKSQGFEVYYEYRDIDILVKKFEIDYKRNYEYENSLMQLEEIINSAEGQAKSYLNRRTVNK